MKTKPASALEPQSILVPVDFSPSSLGALQYALALARRHEARLTLLHVIEPLHPDMLMDFTEAQRSRRAAAHQHLNKLWENTRKAWPRTGRELREGHPVDVITALAKRTRADLVVMGTHGRAGLKRALIGSVAERVVRHARCPVLVVR